MREGAEGEHELSNDGNDARKKKHKEEESVTQLSNKTFKKKKESQQ